ncbi:17810_t:CDS:1 [Funneliformis geosporum]|uniref:8131_t:CDS:1 n=1 Tax=Funneliformis geosporum TaxID=1117311 RepID=A0A9W4SDU6_9GLOM|nr:8131_t:CDS:1 [Funneliformis geosporum]CAI2180699.1 17810_t:CDS:1 [Funneliformis geosporum]
MTLILPLETFQLILKDVDDLKSLHSSLLVNKSWCKSTVAFIWNSPFSFDFHPKRMSKVVPILLSNLPLEIKADLKLENIPESTTFDYGWFIQKLDICALFTAVHWWLYQTYPKRILIPIMKHRNSLPPSIEIKAQNEITSCVKAIYEMILTRTKGLEKLNIISSNRLDSMCYYFMNNIFKNIFILQEAQISYSKITKMYLDGNFNFPFTELSNFTGNIMELSIMYDLQECVELAKEMVAFIVAQKSLEYLHLNLNGMKIWYSILLGLPRNSIKYLAIIPVQKIYEEKVDFTLLSQLSKLEDLHIVNFDLSLNQAECLKTIFIPNLLSLTMKLYSNRLIDDESLYPSLLKNHGRTLRKLKCNGKIANNSYYTSISSFCPNITFIWADLDSIFFTVFAFDCFKTIFVCCPGIQTITVKMTYIEGNYISKFTEILPNSLIFLSIEGEIRFDQLKQLLLYCNNDSLTVDFMYRGYSGPENIINRIKRMFEISKRALKEVKVEKGVKFIIKW